MKNTIRITIDAPDENTKEELIALLSTVAFDAFEEKENELSAFIAEENFNAGVLENLLSSYQLNYTKSIIEDQNWNALWESNFEPVIVNDFCTIRAEFHEPFTEIKHEIIITPKMSFGTGHHATTYLMISEMSKLNFENKEVADFGTGTGVLAILAEKLGSAYVLAVDNDDWSIANAKENIERNGCKKIILEKSEGFIPVRQFDIILANINKNIILKNVDNLLFGLQKPAGKLLLSGLLKEDETEIILAFGQKGLKPVSTVEKNKWICMLLQSNSQNL